MAMGKKVDAWWIDDLPTSPHVKAIPPAAYTTPIWPVSTRTDFAKGLVESALASASIEKLEEYGEIIIKRLEELRNE